MNTLKLLKRMNRWGAGILLFAGLPFTLSAATIEWGAASDISSAWDVYDSGALVEAFNAGADGVSGQTVNGVMFAGTGALLDRSSTTDAFNGDTGDAAYNALLSTIDYGNGANQFTLAVGGGQLVPGTKYTIQVWYVHTSYSGRAMRFGDGYGNTVDLASSPGQFSIGRFTADGGTQALTCDAEGMGQAHITAYQIREALPLEVPEVPTQLTVTNGYTDELVLDWADNDQDGFSHFIVKRSSNSGGPYTPISGAMPTESRYRDSGLTTGVTYHYVVSAVNADAVESADSAPVSATAQVFDTELPNFLFIIADDMDTYSVNRYRETEPCETDAAGNAYPVDTPNLDRLADEGMLFHQARLMGANEGAVCRPSRATIMTGKNMWQREVDVTAATTFPGIFNRGVRVGQGALPYATYRTCKVGNSYPTANAEFTVVNDATKRGNTDGSGSEWHAQWGINYIEDWANTYQKKGQPFFIYLGFSHPHDTRNARETPDLTGRYSCVNTSDPASLVLNTNAPPLPYNHLSCTPETYPAHPFDHGHLDVRDENTVPGVLQYRTEAVIRNEIGRNFACVDWIDRQLGLVLERLEDPNGDGDTSDSIVDNTYVVFTADHGIAIGRHGIQGKQNLYEHTWRVPYIVRGPGIEAGTATDALIYLHDTFPTFCDLAGIELPDTIDSNDGQSFRDVLEGSAADHRDVVYGVYAGGDLPGMRAITDGRFKLIKYDVDDNHTQVTQLFDLEANPFELLPEHGVPNLALEPAYALIRQELEEKLMEKRIEFADPYAFMGDRILLRFENNLEDAFPFGYDGAASGNPVFSADVPNVVDYVVGETNRYSIDLEQSSRQYVSVPDGDAVDFGDAPFTIEAWVKLENLPTGSNEASVMPVAQKKVLGANDSALDYLFLATAGVYGDSGSYSNLALHLGSAVITSSLGIPDTQWHYISVALDPVADTVRFMLDDQIDTQSTTATGAVNDGPLVIGAHFDSSGTIDASFDGLIDEFTITDGFLAGPELQPLQQIPEEPSVPVIHSPVISENGLSLTYESNPYFLYNVESTPRLVDPEWTVEQSFVWDEGPLTTVDLGALGSTSTFYRITAPGPVRP
ncbi:sulfatase-like hydrolase/transferase [Pontiellaceae bacterium B12219]|nr:sulfatase-like hydrolase/transferase [Pontiellaceae bacterium B12219]